MRIRELIQIESHSLGHNSRKINKSVQNADGYQGINCPPPVSMQEFPPLKTNSEVSEKTMLQFDGVSSSHSIVDGRGESLVVMHQNIQHLPSRIDLLNLTLEEISPDILVITKHTFFTRN
ncbi:hypothetical protein J6590_061699 [Homalodisca vitripennis]|nr:hypothetical protein J6590_061699 [Homalodisca vitripennis]